MQSYAAWCLVILGPHIPLWSRKIVSPSDSVAILLLSVLCSVHIGWNCLTLHFSERIPIIKWCATVCNSNCWNRCKFERAGDLTGFHLYTSWISKAYNNLNVLISSSLENFSLFWFWEAVLSWILSIFIAYSFSIFFIHFSLSCWPLTDSWSQKVSSWTSFYLYLLPQWSHDFQCFFFANGFLIFISCWDFFTTLSSLNWMYNNHLEFFSKIELLFLP